MGNQTMEQTAGKPKGISKTIRYFYGVGDMCFALMTNVGVYYSAFYLTNVAQLSLPSVAFLTTVTAMIDAFTAWIYGGVINSVKPMKWGRYRSWLIAVNWLVPVFYFFMYVRIGSTDAVSTFFFFIFMLGARFLHNWGYTANMSLISVVAKTPDDRVAMASSRATWNNMSKFAWSYLGVPFLAILTGIFTEKYAYAVLSLSMSLLMVAGYFFHFKMTEGYEDTGTEELANAAKTKRARTNIVDLLKALFANPPLLCLLIADLAKWLFNFMVAGTVVYYFTYIALNKGMQASYMLIIAFLAVIGAYFSRYIGKMLSGRVTVIACYFIMAAALLAARMLYTSPWVVVALISLAQLGYGCCYSCSSALYADTAVYSEWKSGKNASGWIMGLQNIPLKTASTLKSALLAACLAIGGFSATIAVEDASVAMKESICLALMVIPAILLIIGAVVLLIGFRLPKSRVEQMEREIEERKKAEESVA
ncbi:MAG: MFS transporter [Lachnospiraceae bacterium]|nr:MFS transporter [Lachnospiraceae bacterium]